MFVLLIIGISSCRDSDRDEDITTNSSEDYATGQNIVCDIFKIVQQASFSSKGFTTNNSADTNTLFGCDTLIVDTSSNPKSILIQFDNPCTFNNIARSGTITITTNAKYDTPGASTTVSFSNYQHNSYSILSGTISVIYNGILNGSPNYSFNANDLKIENNKQQSLTWSSTQKISLDAGDTTATTTDDSYSITGTNDGVAFKGNNFNTTISNKLALWRNCNWISAGIVNVSPNNKAVRKLNFGSSCDNKANVSIYDINYDIVFP